MVGEGFSHQRTTKGNAQKHQQQIPGPLYKHVETRTCKLMETLVDSSSMGTRGHIFLKCCFVLLEYGSHEWMFPKIGVPQMDGL